MASNVKRMAQKPVAGALVDYTNPLARGLVLCVPFWEMSGDPQDVGVSRSAIRRMGTTEWRGQSLFQSGAGGNYLDFGNPPRLLFGTSSSFTIHILAAVAGGPGTYRDLIRYDPDGIPRTLLIFRLNNANQLDFSVGHSSSLGTIASTQTIAASESEIRAFTVVRDAAADRLRLYIDGAPAADAADASGSFTLGGSTWQTRFINGTEAFNGRFYLTLIYERALTATEVWSIKANPWSLFYARNRGARDFTTPASIFTGTSALTAAAATLASTGNIPVNAYTGTSALVAAPATLVSTGTVPGGAVASNPSKYLLLGIS